MPFAVTTSPTPRDEQTADRTRSEVVPPLPPQNVRITGRHEAGFYSDKIDCRLHAIPCSISPRDARGDLPSLFQHRYTVIRWFLTAYCTSSASFLAFNISLILYL